MSKMHSNKRDNRNGKKLEAGEKAQLIKWETEFSS